MGSSRLVRSSSTECGGAIDGTKGSDGNTQSGDEFLLDQPVLGHLERPGADAGFCGLLEGDIEWPEVVGALGRVGYRGYLTVEMFRPSRMPPQLFLGELAGELRWIASLAGGAL